MMPAAITAEPSRALAVVRPAARVVDPRVVAIDKARAERGITHERFCQISGVRPRAWYEIRRGVWQPRDKTIAKLEAALTSATSDATPLNIIKAFHRAAFTLLAMDCGADLALMLAQDLSVQRPLNAVWLQAARLNMMAMYITTVELEIKNAVLARAIGGTRQNVKQARDKVEDLRGDDPKIETLLTRVASILTGRA